MRIEDERGIPTAPCTIYFLDKRLMGKISRKKVIGKKSSPCGDVLTIQDVEYQGYCHNTRDILAKMLLLNGEWYTDWREAKRVYKEYEKKNKETF